MEETAEAKESNGLAALKAWREAGGKVERMTPLERAHANPKSKALAIKAACWQCSSGQRDEIKYCTVTKCGLYFVRPYQSKTEETGTED